MREELYKEYFKQIHDNAVRKIPIFIPSTI